MYCLIRYKKHGNTYLAESTGKPNEYRIVEILVQCHRPSKIKLGWVTTQGKKSDIKEFTFFDTIEKLGQYLLERL